VPSFPLVLKVYVVTAEGMVPGRGHAQVAAGAIAGGANAVQLRVEAAVPDRELAPLARELADRCRERGVLLVLNNRLDLAVEVGAGGVHLGQGDGWQHARDRLADEQVLGVSVDTPEQAELAAWAGADYLAATVWATATKPEAAPIGLEGFRKLAESTGLPLVGIGGIDASNARQVLEAGAAGIAVVRAVAAAPDPAEATRELVRVVRGTTGVPPVDRGGR
jgi:thiamine-phosphate pyrophosphorylase